MADKFIRLWEQDNPEYKKLEEGNSNKELLEWAHKEKYIVMKNPFGSSYYYTEQDLEAAKMWKEKTK